MTHLALSSYPDSQMIRARILKGLKEHLVLKDQSIEVFVHEHEVNLTGTVDSLDKKWLAEDVAAEALGVLMVHNQIIVEDVPAGPEAEFYEE